jgi:hypothetical protein
MRLHLNELMSAENSLWMLSVYNVLTITFCIISYVSYLIMDI